MDKSDLLYDVASAQSKEQGEDRRHFDTMATGILALSGALVGVLVFSTADWAHWSIFPAVIGLLGFFGVAATTLASLWLRKWHFQPPLSYLEALGMSGVKLQPFAKVKIASSYMRLYIDLGTSLRGISKNKRRKAIRYGKELPKSIQERIAEKVSLAVRDYLNH